MLFPEVFESTSKLQYVGQGIGNINDGQISRLVNVDNWDSSISPGNLRMARFGFREMNALNSSSETDLRGIW